MLTGGIILAGGSGSRFGGKVPKQFLKLGAQSVLRHSVDKFLSVCDIVVVVALPDWIGKARSSLPKKNNLLFCKGGATRQNSVLNGLICLNDHDPPPDLVAIHDGARPLFSVQLLQSALSLAAKKGSAVPVIPVSSALCRAKNGRITGYVDRSGVFQIQTPQVFLFPDILRIHQDAKKRGQNDATDDSFLFEMSRRTVDTLKGEVTNIKITTPLDLAIAHGILEQLRGVRKK